MKTRIVKWDGYFWAEFFVGHHEIGFEMWCRWTRPYLSLEVLRADLDRMKLARPLSPISVEYEADEIIQEGEVVHGNEKAKNGRT